MTAPRFFVDDPPVDGDVVLSERDAHHARTVLRMHEGDAVVLVDPRGREYAGRLERVDGERLEVAVLERLPTRTPASHAVLFQCLGKGRKMDQVVRQATELGAAAIVPVVSDRTVVRAGEGGWSGKLARWQRIAVEAAKQSRRHDVPEVREPVALGQAAQELASLEGAVVLWEGPGGEPVGAAVEALGLGVGDRVGVLVGPEGGLSDEEAALLRASGARLVSLGPLILRTGTAGVVGLALTLSALGGLAPDGVAGGGTGSRDD